jgi:hypothetical protein
MRICCFIILFIVFNLTACKKDTKKANDIFYVLAEPINVITTPSQGSGHHKITDIWFYSDGKFRGVYPVGKKIPVVKTSTKQRLDFFAGILNSGASQSRLSWHRHIGQFIGNIKNSFKLYIQESCGFLMA